MTTVFVAGSISIKHLHPLFLKRLNTIVDSGFSVVVGDANGADLAVQQALLDRGATNVTVYCSGNRPRNNVGRWQVKKVHSDHRFGSRAFFTAKDIEMAQVADYGLMIWDAKSTGTLSNVMELLRRERSSRVFIDKVQQFITATDVRDLERLLEMMSDEARAKADEKVGLSAKVAAMAHEQLDFVLPQFHPFNADEDHGLPARPELVTEVRLPPAAPADLSEITPLKPQVNPDIKQPVRSDALRQPGLGDSRNLTRKVKIAIVLFLVVAALVAILW